MCSSRTERCCLLQSLDQGEADARISGQQLGDGDHLPASVGMSPRARCKWQRLAAEVPVLSSPLHTPRAGALCSPNSELKCRHRDATPNQRSLRSPLHLQQQQQPLVVVAHSHEADPGVVATTRIYAAGICCPSEVPIIHSVLRQLPGVQHVEVAVVTRTVAVQHAPALACPATLVAALNSAQLGASLTFPRGQAQACRSWVPPPLTLLSLALLLGSLLHYLSVPTGVAWLGQLKWLALAALAVGCPPIVLKAWGAVRSKVLDIHMLMLIAVGGAIALGEYGEAATVVVLFSLADFFENRCSGQARDAISAVLSIRPDTAILACSGVEIPADDVAVGTLILVKPGGMVPLDGLVQKGISSLDESMLTGEAAPVAKAAGSSVSAGTVNVGGGTLTVLTTAVAGDSAVARMAALVETATAEQSPTETMVSRFAKYYTPTVVLACLCLAFLPWAFGAANRRWTVYLALQLLVTACPCALVISVPVTMVSAVARAAQMGALIKGGSYVEALARVKVMTFDKTGTLTVGSFHITHLDLGTQPPSLAAGAGTAIDTSETPAPGVSAAPLPANATTCEVAAAPMAMSGVTEPALALSRLGSGARSPLALSEGEVLRLVGSLERRGSHPIASVIVGRAAAQGIVCDAAVEHSTQVPGCGLVGEVEGHSVVAGTAGLLASSGVVDRSGRMAQAVVEWGKKGVTLCFVAVDGTYAGLIAAQDAPRKEAQEALAKLDSLGLSTAMMTGDGQEVARAVGEATGMAAARVHSSLLPADKLGLVAQYQRGPGGRRIYVAHVGDGANDAPALAAADVGCAMGVAGSAAAVEAGDVALFSNDLRLLPALLELSRRARGKVLENIFLAVLAKAVVVALASFGMFSLWGAVLVDVGSMLVVTLNGVSLLAWRRGEQYSHAVGAIPQHAHPHEGVGAHHHHHCCSGGTHHGDAAPYGPHACCHGSHAEPCCGSTRVNKRQQQQQGGQGGYQPHIQAQCDSYCVHEGGGECCGSGAGPAEPEADASPYGEEEGGDSSEGSQLLGSYRFPSHPAGSQQFVALELEACGGGNSGGPGSTAGTAAATPGPGPTSQPAFAAKEACCASSPGEGGGGAIKAAAGSGDQAAEQRPLSIHLEARCGTGGQAEPALITLALRQDEGCASSHQGCGCGGHGCGGPPGAAAPCCGALVDGQQPQGGETCQGARQCCEDHGCSNARRGMGGSPAKAERKQWLASWL